MNSFAGGQADIDEGALKAVVRRAARADPDAWELLYRRSYSRLFAYTRRRLTSDSAADDAVSETMLRALDRISSFTWQGAGFDAWLYGIARNVVLEAHRHDGRVVASDSIPDGASVAELGPLDAVVRRDHHAEVRSAFERLSPDDQEVLELRVVAGLTADGAAAVMGRAPGAIRMAQSRALGRLRVHYGDLGYAD